VTDAATIADPPARPKRILSRILSIFAEVHGDEALTVLLLTLNVFLLLTAYYFLKTIREPYILENRGGAELKSYAGGMQALVLIFVVFGYNALVKRLGRMQLAATVYLFFIANLVLFSLLGRANLPAMGVIFFVWVGCFNLTSISQFWAFANDCYTPAEGKRLFTIVAFGGSAGSLAGSYLAGLLYGPLGRYNLMLAAAAVLLGCLLVTYTVHRLETRRALRTSGPGRGASAGPVAEQDASGGFSLIAKDRYLLLIAALVFILNWEKSTGEYIVDRELTQFAHHQTVESVGKVIGAFKANFFFWINAIGMVVQLFFVSRVLKYIDVKGALLVGPVVGLLGYGSIALSPSLGTARIAKIAENSSDYSLQSTVNKLLFLPTSRAAKYSAQVAIGGVVVRLGDMASSGVTYLGSEVFAWSTRGFAAANLILLGAWFAVAVALGRANAARSAAMEPPASDSAASAPPASASPSPARP
jgi:ATP:ADP antiporter, AAA family